MLQNKSQDKDVGKVWQSLAYILLNVRIGDVILKYRSGY